MAGEREQRRLAAILAADAVGYSRRMAEDESGALAALRALREEVLQPMLAAHGGRLFNAAGDGFLAEFPSTVEALRCALAVQGRLLQDPDGMPLRIGVHVGDVVVQGGDLLGDGVNIAARLQALAEPGGICLSGRVKEDVSGRLALAATDMGEQRLKNIPQPVRVFHLRAEASSAAPAPAATLPPFDRPALAVLPFANMSTDAEQEHFADGITEELITALSRARWFYVIARNSTFIYKGRAVDIRQVGRELGVRYVLEGSVRRAGGRVRITGQLIEAETGHHVWADRFDGPLDDIFELQDRVAESVAAAIEPSLQHAEVRRAQARPTESLTAYGLYLRALPLHFGYTREGSDEALGLLRLALRHDPGFALGKALLSSVVTIRRSMSWEPDYPTEEAIRLAREALASGAEDPLALAWAGFSLAYLAFDNAAGLEAVRRAQQLNPNSSQVELCAGYVLNYAGQPGPAMLALERSMRLSPLDPARAYTLVGMGMSKLIGGDYPAALGWGEQALTLAPGWAPGARLRIAALWLLGREEEARAAARETLALLPHIRVRSSAYRDAAFRDRYVGALMAAGLPE